ncbi:MAG: riboflavin synthase [Alphaproteobacteria bacterium]|nr:riboflavin synthase [Alphaproteobacteria bacterium]
MFTGIITDIGVVRAVAPRGAARDMRLTIATTWPTAGITLGASVACAGCCLTVVEKGPDWLAFEASAETLARTTLGSWQAGTRVNLERPLRVGDELGGHIVAGHVDAVGRVAECRPEGGSLRLAFDVPATLGGYVAKKGSVAVDGVSLTVNEVDDRRAEGTTRFTVNIIPHTQAVTTLGALAPGAAVNVEVDTLARYVARMQEAG